MTAIILTNVKVTRSFGEGLWPAVLGEEETRLGGSFSSGGSFSGGGEVRQEQPQSGGSFNSGGGEGGKTEIRTGTVGTEGMSEGQKQGLIERMNREGGGVTTRTGKSEFTTSEGSRIRREQQGGREETEVETAGGGKIKTRTESDGTSKVEVERGDFKMKYETEAGRTRLKVENERGEEVEMSAEKMERMKQEMESERGGVRIETRDGGTAISRNQVSATGNFPLSVDTTTNQLIVSTPKGDKVVTVLPDEAVNNMIATGVISQLGGAAGATPLSGAEVRLETRNDELVYQIEGEKSQRLFGFIPITTEATTYVSAETGGVVEQEQSFWASLVERLSF